MRRAVLGRFILVLLAALCINSVIFYVSASHLLMRTTAGPIAANWHTAIVPTGAAVSGCSVCNLPMAKVFPFKK